MIPDSQEVVEALMVDTVAVLAGPPVTAGLAKPDDPGPTCHPTVPG